MLWKDRRTDRQTDRQTDGQMKAISIIPHLLCGGGLKKNRMLPLSADMTGVFFKGNELCM